jgi:hypothetical protein
MMTQQMEKPKVPGPEPISKTAKAKGTKPKTKALRYQAGKSCLAKGLKEHDYKPTPSGKSLKCSRCGSTKTLPKGKAK